jgi:hypothetical protein
MGDPSATQDAATKGYVDTAVSDEKYKTNVETLLPGASLQKVLDIPARSFRWRDDVPENIGKDDDKGRDILGFIAQEIEAVIPEAVADCLDAEGEFRHKAIRRDSLIPVMWSAIQELTKRIEDLESV